MQANTEKEVKQSSRFHRNHLLATLPFVELLNWSVFAHVCRQFAEVIRSNTPGSPYYQKQFQEQTKNLQWVPAYLYRPTLSFELLPGWLQVNDGYPAYGENTFRGLFLFKMDDRLVQVYQDNVCRVDRHFKGADICSICEGRCTGYVKQLRNVYAERSNPLISYLFQKGFSLCNNCDILCTQVEPCAYDRALIKGLCCSWHD